MYLNSFQTGHIFASELLLPDEIVMETLKVYPYFDAAKILGVPPEILGFKMIVLKKKELIDCEIPVAPKSQLHRYDFF